ncbi:GDSL-type esterase/lipase family protein [Pontibacter ramchanderi]|uniref:Sialate O-acetylesterase n=1 Tax=Pontibacter ramchanderi TaxID=1179743 RepID=A0A2N3U875_9BACT|nr:GDSL-type esterase/lipase family protein [Pontibacter ramchanderi]PKV62952.1 sialate O-acetylesterase [Pontibacter ramchanderi]
MIRYILFYLLCMCAIPGYATQSSTKLKVACIGNSVTYGYGLQNREQEAYPVQLQQHLGAGYEVANFGLSGATLLRKGHRPYTQTQQYRDAITFRPDIAVIHLGLNDTDPRNWPNYRDEFAADYYHLIDTLRAANPRVRIVISRLTPIFSGHPRFKSGTRDWFWQIQERIPLIAQSRGVELIDLHTPLHRRPDLFPDNLHPTAEGAALIAATVAAHLTGRYGGLQLAPVFTDHMVLQQRLVLPVYGIADAGQEVVVRFGNETRKATTGADGRWRVELSPQKAGGPFQMEVSTTDKKILVQDILVGEVWLCSGQSNMAFPLKASQEGRREMRQAQQTADIRLLHMKPLAETGNFVWDSTTLRKVNQLAYFSGTWQRCDSTAAGEYSAVAFHFGKQLRERLKVPVGLIQVAVGGSTTESWIDRHTLEHHPQLVDMLHNWRSSDFVMGWARERAGVNTQGTANAKQRHPYEPAYNFEAGIAALTLFPIKGVIWYQGESNAHNTELHEELFRTLVRGWREKWGGDIPFYYAQLSSIDRPGWQHFRDSQRRLLSQLKNTGMAVTSDLGDSLDVHPTQKRQVGNRLAAWALANTYRQRVPYSGPLFDKARFVGQQAVCSFEHAKGLRASDGTVLRGFEVAGSDMVFHKASAEIRGSQVWVSAEKVPAPKYVRYAWEPFTRANLVNKAGFPASTFTSFTTRSE